VACQSVHHLHLGVLIVTHTVEIWVPLLISVARVNKGHEIPGARLGPKLNSVYVRVHTTGTSGQHFLGVPGLKFSRLPVCSPQGIALEGFSSTDKYLLHGVCALSLVGLEPLIFRSAVRFAYAWYQTEGWRITEACGISRQDVCIPLRAQVVPRLMPSCHFLPDAFSR